MISGLSPKVIPTDRGKAFLHNDRKKLLVTIFTSLGSRHDVLAS